MTKIHEVEEGEIIYQAKDAPKIYALKVVNNTVSVFFYLALILLAYNCETCGGPRMSWW